MRIYSFVYSKLIQAFLETLLFVDDIRNSCIG